MRDNKISYRSLYGRRQEKTILRIACGLGVLLLCLLAVLIILLHALSEKDKELKSCQGRNVELEKKVEMLMEQQEEGSNPEVDQERESEIAEEEPEEPADTKALDREAAAAGIYTFLQGPRSWEERLAWSGEWGETYYDGDSFGNFGCGLCCMANIYSTLTPYKATPVDLYFYAKKYTDYYGGGPIAWEYMQKGLSLLGMNCELRKKPKTYNAFCESIRDAECAIVLVCSYNSDCYWENTDGHYVTIFSYDEEKKEVFLADSGDPDHNRQWVGLDKIYKSLKTSSKWQYLSVTGYDKESCKWKNKKMKGNWVQP